MSITIPRPAESEYKPFYHTYISMVPDGDLLKTLADQFEAHAKALAQVPADREQHRYAPDKWTVAEVVGHLADSERVFAYRILRFARNDATPLPGFDEKAWTPASNYAKRRLADVVAEFRAVRQGTLALLKGLGPEALIRTGTANNSPVSVRALAYTIAGHERHHMKILKERYGIGA
ncbi:MAG TPA: DinB family protein [Gemmatimonadales bacterium]|nr:DinB family protein [Gemmatimonadales bacterium]